MATPIGTGNRLKAVRLGAGLGQEEFAASLGYSKRSVIAWERDSASVPIKVVALLRTLYDIDPEWMIMGADAIPVAHYGAADWTRFDRLADMLNAVLCGMGADLSQERRRDVVRTLYDAGDDVGPATRARLRGIVSALANGSGLTTPAITAPSAAAQTLSADDGAP